MNLQDTSSKTSNADRTQILARFCLTVQKHAHAQDLLEAATRLIPDLIDSRGAVVLLLDSQTNTFYIPAACFDEATLTERFKAGRFPSTADSAGEVLRSGQPSVVHEYKDSPYALQQDDQSLSASIQNRLDTPLWRAERIIGVFSAINKKNGRFNPSDVELLSAVSALTAMAMDKLVVQEKLIRSDHHIQGFNHAKDRVIDHISHTLKTPIAVLIASLKLLERHLILLPDQTWCNVYRRAQRNLERLLSIEYEVEDILRRQDDSNSEPQFEKSDLIDTQSGALAKRKE